MVIAGDVHVEVRIVVRDGWVLEDTNAFRPLSHCLQVWEQGVDKALYVGDTPYFECGHDRCNNSEPIGKLSRGGGTLTTWKASACTSSLSYPTGMQLNSLKAAVAERSIKRIRACCLFPAAQQREFGFLSTLCRQ